jgi:hypothetical protein
MSYHALRPRWARPPEPKTGTVKPPPKPLGPQVGDLVRMKYTETSWDDEPYWTEGCIGRIMGRQEPFREWGDSEPSWQIRFDGCGNAEGTFTPNPVGWRSFHATFEDMFTLWAKKGGPDDCFVQPG